MALKCIGLVAFIFLFCVATYFTQRTCHVPAKSTTNVASFHLTGGNCPIARFFCP